MRRTRVPSSESEVETNLKSKEGRGTCVEEGGGEERRELEEEGANVEE